MCALVCKKYEKHVNSVAFDLYEFMTTKEETCAAVVIILFRNAGKLKEALCYLWGYAYSADSYGFVCY